MLLAYSMVRLPNHPVMLLDRMTMAHGLKARSPCPDRRLAKFAGALPVHFKIRGSRRRYLQMSLAERYIPREVLRRPKQGWSSAFSYMMVDQFRALFRTFLPDSHIVGAGPLRGDVVGRLRQQHLGGRTDHGNRVWLLLNAELWYRMKLEGEACEDMTALICERVETSHAATVEPSLLASCVSGDVA